MNTSVCLTSTWTVLLHTGNITAFYCPPVVPREIQMCVLWPRGLSVSFCDPAYLLKKAFGGTGVKTVLVFS